MARGTVIRYRLAIGAGVTAIVAAEAAWRIVVSEIIRMNAPGHTHVWKNVAKVDCRPLIARFLHQRPPRLINLRIIRTIEIVEFLRNTLLGYIARGIIHLENFDCFLLDERKFWADVSKRHLLVHSVFGQVEGMCGPVVAIHAVHRAMLSLVQLLGSRL